MFPEDIEAEIQRLKTKKIEIGSKIKLTRDFNEKEILNEELERIENQIKILETVKI